MYIEIVLADQTLTSRSLYQVAKSNPDELLIFRGAKTIR